MSEIFFRVSYNLQFIYEIAAYYERREKYLSFRTTLKYILGYRSQKYISIAREGN